MEEVIVETAVPGNQAVIKNVGTLEKGVVGDSGVWWQGGDLLILEAWRRVFLKP